MRKLTKKISMLMVLAMLVGLFSGVVSASAASAWSFKSGKYNVAVGGEINMKKNEYADFDLLKDGKAPEGYTVVWKSSDEDVVWVNAKTGQLRADKAKKAEDGDKAVISATFTNTKTKKSATRSFTIVVGEVKAPVYTVEQADVTAVLGDAIKFAPVVKNEAGEVVKFATHKSYNGYFLDGKAITNPWTPEAAGEYTVTVAQFASKADVADLAKAVRKIDVKVTVKADLAAEATKVKEITVYGDFAKDAKFTVKKGTGIGVTVEKVTVAEDGKSATLALKNRITKGDYTITYGDSSVVVKCEDEYPKTVIIEEKDGVVAVNATRTEAYAHYDVLNQYGESVRKTTNVMVSSSANGTVRENRATGRVVISTTGSATFIYGSQIVLNIAATGYSAFDSAIMTAGLENTVDVVKIAGVTLADSNKIVQEIPVNFLGAKDESTSTWTDTDATYFYLLFQRLDRTGHVMEVEDSTPTGLAAIKNELFFASLNPMLVKEFGTNLEVKRINGVEYLAIKVVPGMMAKKGGIATIEIRSNKTGGATEYDLRVVSDQILNQFTILPYEDIIVKDTQFAEGWRRQTTVTLKYEAIDTNGETITDFRALYDRVYFSDPNVKLEEAWDGSATLTYTVPWTNMNPTKDFDVPVVINAIVPEGSGNTITLYVKEARYVDNIDGYVGNNSILEGGSLNINLGSSDGNAGSRLQIVDQYDAVLGDDQNDLPDYSSRDTFFKGTVANKRALYYGVKLTGKDVGTALAVSGNATYAAATAEGYTVFTDGEDLKLIADKEVTDKTEQYTIEFVLLDANQKPLSASAKAYTFYVVDINQAVSFELKSDQDALIENNNADKRSFYVEAKFTTGGSARLDNTNVAGATDKYYVTYKSTANVYTPDSTTGVVYGVLLSDTADVTASLYTGLVGPLKHATQFHNMAVLNADGTYGSRNVPVDVTAQVYVGAISGTSYAGTYQLKDTLKGNVEVGNHARRINNIVLKSYFTGGIQATNATITHGDFVGNIDMFGDTYNDYIGDWGDWAKPTMTMHRANTTVTISNLKENLDNGLKYGNLKLVNNVTGTLIEGAEVGDTFTATFGYVDANGDTGVKLTIDCVVGPDKKAYIDGTQKAENVIWY